MRLSVSLIVSITAVSGLIGCGGDERKLVPVSGTVTINGKPLRDAVITFLPADSNKGALPGEDISGPEGNYKAMTRGRTGLAAGKYKVVVTRSAVETSKVPAAFKDDPYMRGSQPRARRRAGTRRGGRLRSRTRSRENSNAKSSRPVGSSIST
jgi:hypothetical protein